MINPTHFSKWFYALQMAKGRAVDENMMLVWYGFLKDYDSAKVEHAFKLCAMSPDGFPNVGKLIESMKGKAEVVAIERWAHVLRIAERGEEPESKLLKDAVRVIGGIKKIGRCESEYDLNSKMRRFIEYYASKYQENVDSMAGITHDKPKEIAEERSAEVKEARK